ncbi:MAG: hypothetical protein NC114_10550 [Ruminococcus flavefaciens]|nr:hypothetical protein [Ruminococcus flavefaciens]
MMRQVQNMMVGAIAELSAHDGNVDAHRGIVEQCQLGVDRSDWEEIESEVTLLLYKVSVIRDRQKSLEERIARLENG